jgi:DNA-binding HxlR family transcriptional regulator
MFTGKKRFSEFLTANSELSTKMLSARLKELQKHCLVEKKIANTDPFTIEYELTDRGKHLNKIIFELARFSMENYTNEILVKPSSQKKIIKETEKMFAVN